MFESTLPQRVRLYSRPDVALKFRPTLTQQDSILWLSILAKTPWETMSRPTWANNETLSEDTGIGEPRRVERSIARLRRAGMLTTRHGDRGPRAKRRHGRILEPDLRQPVQLLVPDRDAVARLWALGRMQRKRPASLVLVALGAYALACEANDSEHLQESAPIEATQGDLRALIGVKRGSTWSRRIGDLVEMGVVERYGRAVWVTPPARWSPSDIAMDEASAQDAETKQAGDPRPPAPPPDLPPWWPRIVAQASPTTRSMALG